MPINDYNNPYYWGFKIKIILDFNNYGTIKDKNRKDKQMKIELNKKETNLLNEILKDELQKVSMPFVWVDKFNRTAPKKTIRYIETPKQKYLISIINKVKGAKNEKKLTNSR